MKFPRKNLKIGLKVVIVEEGLHVQRTNSVKEFVVILTKNLNKQFQEERDKLLRRYGVFD